MTVEQEALLSDVVWVDPGRVSGTPCFKGTRVPIQALIDHIEGNSLGVRILIRRVREC
jgi:uncharacterized protein (DUF433 family)